MQLQEATSVSDRTISSLEQKLAPWEVDQRTAFAELHALVVEMVQTQQSIQREASRDLAQLIRVLAKHDMQGADAVITLGNNNNQRKARITISGDVAKGNIINLTLPPAVDAKQITQVITALLNEAGGRVKRSFSEPGPKEALHTALDASFEAAFDGLPIAAQLQPDVEQRFAGFLHSALVVSELALLLHPAGGNQIDHLRLRDQFIDAGFAPDCCTESEFDTFLGALFAAFIRAVDEQPALQGVIHIGLLRTLIQQSGAQVLAAEQTAQNTTTLVELVEQSVQGQRDIHHTLEVIRASITQEPGRVFDAYQMVAAGLGRIGADVTTDARGEVIIATETLVDLERPFDKHPFLKLLVQMREVLLGSALMASREELERRRKSYCELLIAQFTDLKLDGLSMGGRPIKLPLEKVYVQLRAVAEVPEAADAFSPDEKRMLRLLDEQRERRGEDDPEMREARLRLDARRQERWTHERLERFPIGDALRDAQRRGLVVLGDPGSGKTTLLQFLALVFAHGPERVAAHFQLAGDEGARLPIFAPLASYDEMLKEQPELTVEEFLARYYDRRRAMPGLGPVFHTALEAGRALILLDGLDEVVEEGRRRFVSEQASAFIRSAIGRGNRVLLTSRVYGYRDAPLSVDLPHISVLDFRRDEIEVFARQWCRAMAVWDAEGQETAQTELLAQEKERALLKDIRSNPGVERLAVNPLLLTMLALLQRQVGSLPQRRIKLYDKYVEALLITWEQNRSRGARLERPAQIDPQEAENVLIDLAFWLQQHRGSGTASQYDLQQQLGGFYLRDEGLDAESATTKQRRDADKRAQRFIKDMRQFSGLLIERGHNAFGFRHLTFQEYFAGRALAIMGREERWRLIQPNLHANRWREPILLAAARLGTSENRGQEATELVRRILDAGSAYEARLHRDLFLAADCANDDIDIAVSLLRRIAGALLPLLDASVPSVAKGALERLDGLRQLRSTANERPRLSELSNQFATWLDVKRIAKRPALVRDALLEIFKRLLPDHEELCTRTLTFAADSDWEVRQAAVQVIASVGRGNSEVQNVLLERLADEYQNVRQAAVAALGTLVGTDPEVRAALLERLADEYQNVRQAAVAALGTLVGTDPEVRAALLERLADAHWIVQQAAVTALGTLVASDLEVRAALLERLADAQWIVRWVTVTALGTLVASDLEVRAALLERLADAQGNVQQAAVAALGTLVASDLEVRAALLERLADADPNVRQAAVAALGTLVASDLEVRTALLERLADDYPNVRQAAVEAAMRFIVTVPTLLETVRPTLQHPDWRTRETMLRQLGSKIELITTLHTLVYDLKNVVITLEAVTSCVGAIQTLQPLIIHNPVIRAALLERLADADPNVRLAAVAALGTLVGTDEQVRTALLERLADADPNVRQAAIAALGTLVGTDLEVRTALLERLADADPNVRQAAIAALGTLVGTDLEVRTALLERLADGYPNVRQAAVAALGTLVGTDPEVHADLLEHLADVQWNVRQAAVAALGTLVGTDEQVRTALLERLADEDNDVRQAAVAALSTLVGTDLEVRADLLERLADAHWNVRQAAVAALGTLVASDLEMRADLLERFADADPNVRQAAVAALGTLVASDLEMRTALLERLADADPNVRQAAVEALGTLVGTDVEVRAALLERLADAQWNVRQAAVAALGTLVASDLEVRTALLERLTNADPIVRQASVVALGTLVASDLEVRTALLERLADGYPSVRQAAVDALAPCVFTDEQLRQQLLPIIWVSDQERRMYSLSRDDRSRPLVAAFAHLIQQDDAFRAQVIDLLGHIDWRQRWAAAEILRAAGEEYVIDALPQLLAALEDRRGLDSWPARIAAAELLLNDYHHTDEMLELISEALDYGADLLLDVPGADEVRKQAALALGRLKASEGRPDVIARLEQRMSAERDPDVLDALYSAMLSLVAAPEAEA